MSGNTIVKNLTAGMSNGTIVSTAYLGVDQIKRYWIEQLYLPVEEVLTPLSRENNTKILENIGIFPPEDFQHLLTTNYLNKNNRVRTAWGGVFSNPESVVARVLKTLHSSLDYQEITVGKHIVHSFKMMLPNKEKRYGPFYIYMGQKHIVLADLDYIKRMLNEDLVANQWPNLNISEQPFYFNISDPSIYQEIVTDTSAALMEAPPFASANRMSMAVSTPSGLGRFFKKKEFELSLDVVSDRKKVEESGLNVKACANEFLNTLKNYAENVDNSYLVDIAKSATVKCSSKKVSFVFPFDHEAIKKIVSECIDGLSSFVRVYGFIFDEDPRPSWMRDDEDDAPTDYESVDSTAIDYPSSITPEFFGEESSSSKHVLSHPTNKAITLESVIQKEGNISFNVQVLNNASLFHRSLAASHVIDDIHVVNRKNERLELALDSELKMPISLADDSITNIALPLKKSDEWGSAIVGQSSVTLPNAIVKRRFTAEDVGRSVQFDGLRMEILDWKYTKVTFVYLDREGRVLEIRPLNEKGEPLNIGGASTRKTKIWNNCEKHRVNLGVSGNVHALEFVYVNEYKDYTFPFSLPVSLGNPTLGEVSPSFLEEAISFDSLEEIYYNPKKGGWKRHALGTGGDPYYASGKECNIAGPLNIYYNTDSSSFGDFLLTVYVKAPLENFISAYSPFAKLEIATLYSAGKEVWSREECEQDIRPSRVVFKNCETSLGGRAELKLEDIKDQESIDRVELVATLSLPKNINKIKISPCSLGERVSIGEYSYKVVAFKSDMFVLKPETSEAPILDVKCLDEQGNSRALGFEINSYAEEMMLAEIPNNCEYLFYLADATEEKSYRVDFPIDHTW